MQNKSISIGHTFVGIKFPPYLIAEIGLNHNGSIKLAKDLIKSAALSGANMVKFQKRNIDELATKNFLEQPFDKCPSLGRTQREVREKLELSKEQLIELKNYSNEFNLDFSFSIFDSKSLELALDMDLDVIKIPSHSSTNLPLLKKVSQCKKPVILSLGGCSWKEKEKAVSILENSDLILMHCISSYPTKDEEIKINTIEKIRNHFNKVVGFSGHEMSYEISAASVLLGASLIERHFTLSRSMIGLDHKISLEPDEFSKMFDLANRFFKSRGIISKNIENNEKSSRHNYHVSICSQKFIPKGKLIQKEDICCKQPRGNELDYFGGLEYDRILNSIALVDIQKDVPIPKNSIKLIK